MVSFHLRFCGHWLACHALAASLFACSGSREPQPEQLDLAALLARCKMGELEEMVARDGVPSSGLEDSDACCQGAEQEGFRCQWSLHPPAVPDAPAPAIPELDPASDPEATRAALDDAMKQAVHSAFANELETQVRLARVQVSWTEQEQPQAIEVVQWLLAPQPRSEPTPETR